MSAPSATTGVREGGGTRRVELPVAGLTCAASAVCRRTGDPAEAAARTCRS